jgi:hypothetical protein
MTDNMKTVSETPPTRSLARAAVDSAKLAWEAATARCEAAHRAAISNLDQTSGLTIGDCAVLGTQTESAAAMVGDPKLRQSILARMDNRTLLLADALQRHALVRIMETGAAADEIARAVASTKPPIPKSHDS